MLTKFFLNFFRFLILDPHYTGSEDLKLINGKVRDISYAAEPGMQGGKGARILNHFLLQV